MSRLETGGPTDATTTEPNVTESPNTDDDLKFLLIPIVVILIVMLLSALVYLMAKRKRRELIRENILSLYEIDTNEEWDSINSYDHASYSAMDYTTSF